MKGKKKKSSEGGKEVEVDAETKRKAGEENMEIKDTNEDNLGV
jgi:hypothetical protein